MTETPLVLKTVLGDYGQVMALKEGIVVSERLKFAFVEDYHPTNRAFRPMVERLPFAVSEMALTTYMVAKSFGKKMTALPVVPMRLFHHGAIQTHAKAGIRSPKDLEGKRVGLRAYSQTGPTWSRGILQHEYGVDLGRINWVSFEGSHVAEYQDPGNVVRAEAGKKLGEMLLAGEIDAAIGAEKLDSPDVKPLFARASDEEAAWFKKTGIYPVNHVVVVKSDLVAAHPWLLGELFGLFKAAKERYLATLAYEGAATPEDEKLLRQKAIVGEDPLPYGMAANRLAIETLSRYCTEQGLLPRPYALEEFFEPSALALA
ncbi:MAG: ABC transporter substrate-binding protein [Deltaproteobacteria bacterium]|nr:ABC transporter substrate-binding protein [Deltaproteobacteria bacterium]